MSLSVNDYIKYDLYQLFLLNKSNFKLSLLRKAYQRQVLIYHPDKFPSDLSEELKKEKMDTFLLINNAYTILSNETNREEYDSKRETYLNEEKGFISLKTQFQQDTKSKLSKEELEVQKENAKVQFEKMMKDMNSELEKLALGTSSEREDVNVNVQSQVLQPETVKPSNAFDSELSNIIANRNVKMENTGTELYSGLSNSSDKYAFINEAFK